MGMSLAVGRGIVVAVPVVADKMHRTAAGVVLAAVAGPVETLAIRHVEVDRGNTSSGGADCNNRCAVPHSRRMTGEGGNHAPVSRVAD